jgi:iron complex outermembrane receptor protein
MLKTIVALLAIAAPAMAQDPVLPASDPTKLPTTRVTVYRELGDASELPVSVDAVSGTVLEDIEAKTPSDAVIFAPNTFFSEFTARKLSNPRFRGIGSSPMNPGVTTYFDGVPQLHANSSSIELLDIEQIEFARGPFSALYGRNALGGIINVTSRRPPLTRWDTTLSTSTGSFAEWRQQLHVAGPIGQQLAAGLTFGGSGRKGYTVNDITGRDLDSRAAAFFKGQLWWTPSTKWESRVIVANELSHDGDYGLNDLASLRANPFHAARNYEGDTRRNVFSTTVIGRYEDALYSLATTTGFVRWTTHDRTDLDYTPFPLVTRQNNEKDFQFTQDLRFAVNTPAPITDDISIKWQAGLFFFTQRYSQNAVNTYEAFVFSPFVDFPVAQTTPDATLKDGGIGLYGQTTVSIMKRLDVIIGLRADHEGKDAELHTTFDPALAPSTDVIEERSFSNWSPEFAGAYHFESGSLAYISFGRGYKAGGFNAASPPGSESYGAENAYHVELGAKAELLDGKMSVTGSLFSIDWNQMQLNLPDPVVPAQFYIANIDGAKSKGLELELRARPHPDVDFFGGLGLTKARFDNGVILGGIDVSRNLVPNTPQHTFTLGTEVRRALMNGVTVFGHFDTWFNGGFRYNELNVEGQKAYALVNFRAGARGGKLLVDFWMKNVGNTKYIPIAFAFDQNIAPSGFLGEMGAPRRYGVSAQVQID